MRVRNSVFMGKSGKSYCLIDPRYLFFFNLGDVVNPVYQVGT